MRRLVNSEIKAYRNRRLAEQGGLCPLCGDPIDPLEAVLDHCHKTGECRAVVHRGCNVILGKVENFKNISKLQDDKRFGICMRNIPDYIKDSRLGVLHPTHRTEREKKDRANARARKARAKLKKEKMNENIST